MDTKIAEIDNDLESKVKAQGWLRSLFKSNEGISLDEVWKVVSQFKNQKRQCLINDICSIKKIEKVKV